MIILFRTLLIIFISEKKKTVEKIKKSRKKLTKIKKSEKKES